MAAAPTVRELNSLIAELGQSILPQKQLIDADIARTEMSGAAQEAGLGAAKDKEFKGIGQRAQNKGMFFSGFAPNEEAEYTGGTYLPALAALQATIAQTRSSLLGKKADLDADIFGKAFQTRENDINAKNTWESEQERRAWEADQARIERESRAAEAEKDRRASLAAAASKSSASAAPKLTKNARGGWDVSEGYDLAGYARATGADLITLLSQGDAEDRRAAGWYMEKINKYGTENADKYFQELQRDRPTAFYRGG